MIDQWTPLSRRMFLQGIGAGAGVITFGGIGLAEPFRPDSDSSLLAHTDVPRNAETPLAELPKNWITPTELFYVRSHGENPSIDRETYRLTVEGMVATPLQVESVRIAGPILSSYRDGDNVLCRQSPQRTQPRQTD